MTKLSKQKEIELYQEWKIKNVIQSEHLLILLYKIGNKPIKLNKN